MMLRASGSRTLQANRFISSIACFILLFTFYVNSSIQVSNGDVPAEHDDGSGTKDEKPSAQGSRGETKTKDLSVKVKDLPANHSANEDHDEKGSDNLPSKGISHELTGDNLSTNVNKTKTKTSSSDGATNETKSVHSKEEDSGQSGDTEKDMKHDYAQVHGEKESSEYSGDSASEEKSDNLPIHNVTTSSELTADVDMGSSKSPFNYLKYQPYNKIVKELKRIEASDDKDVKKSVFSIGTTFEKRTLWAIRLQDKQSDKPLKKTIFIDCGAHAREWLAPSTCMWLVNEFTKPKGSMRDLLKKYDWVFLPLLNPDGYAFTWEKDKMRLWRKNRSFDDKQLKKYKETDDPMCIGVDINRNFNNSWGGVGAATENPCDETYAGSEPFSEKESKALAKYLTSVEKDLIAYVTLHTYGQLWMTPWGHTSKKPQDNKELKRVAYLAVESMKKNSGVNYTVGSSHDVLYSHSGTSVDWAYSKLDIPYTYVVEMIPKDDNPAGFDLPASSMVKNAKDIVVGIRTMAENLKEGQENHSDGFDKAAAKVLSAVRDALKHTTKRFIGY